MPQPQYQGLSIERDGEGRTTAYTYHGSRSAMETLAASHTIGEVGSAGRLKSLKLRHRGDTIWECELVYELSADGTSVTAPDTDWGHKSCRLHGGMLSRPLEKHPEYRMCWNRYLCARIGVNAVPAWHTTAANELIPAADRDNYVWTGSAAAPDGFRIVAVPLKPGVESFDTAVYTVTETARFRTAAAAGAMVAAKLNRIGAPAETFGNSGGNWKCDDAGVSWNGKYWLARLTWTRSGEDDGWDGDIYGSAGN